MRSVNRYGIVRAALWAAVTLPLFVVIATVLYVVLAFVAAAIGVNP